jgi:hypothetical protein
MHVTVVGNVRPRCRVASARVAETATTATAIAAVNVAVVAAIVAATASNAGATAADTGGVSIGVGDGGTFVWIGSLESVFRRQA